MDKHAAPERSGPTLPDMTETQRRHGFASACASSNSYAINPPRCISEDARSAGCQITFRNLLER